MMRKICISMLSFAVLSFSLGCSEKTQNETNEALKETGEAISSAAEDAAENTEKAAKEVGDAIKGSDTE